MAVRKPKSAYVVCPKCGVNHSTLVKHKCFKPDEQDKPKMKDTKPDEGTGPGVGGGESEAPQGGDKAEGEAKADGSSKGKGEGQGEADGKGEGSGSGEGQGEGDGKGEGEGEGEGEAPEPQMPNPDERPEAVICSVLKYAALTAACAKNGVIEVTLAEDGLFVYGHSGEVFAHDTMPWGEFEQRSTVDGQFYVKAVIDAVDEKIGGAAPEVKGTKLTLPLYEGQKVFTRDGRLATVVKAGRVSGIATLQLAEGVNHHVFDDSGRQRRIEGTDHPTDAVEDAPEPPAVKVKAEAKAKRKAKKADAPKLTLPLTVGQRVVDRNGDVGVVERLDAEGDAVVGFGGPSWWYKAATGLFGGQEDDMAYGQHLAADAPAAKLTLPLYVGQKVVDGKGRKHLITGLGGDARHDRRVDRQMPVATNEDGTLYFVADGRFWTSEDHETDEHLVADVA